MNIKKILLAFLTASTLWSCEKDVTDLQPVDGIVADRAFQNMNDVLLGTIGVYGSIQARRQVYINSYISDEIRLGTGSEYRNVGNILFNWQHVSDSQDWRDTETGGVWTNMYFVIDRINRVLELGNPVQPANAAEAALKQQYRAELLALRAYAHLELLRTFANHKEYDPNALGVTLRTTFVKEPSSYKSTRNTSGEVVAAINADLAEARSLMPATFTNNSRITRNAIIALQVRTALFTKQWQTVVDRATELLALQPISSGATYTSIWTTRTLPENLTSSEVIWKYNIQQANLGLNIGSLFQDNPPTNALQATFSEKLFQAIDTALDARKIFLRFSPRRLINKYGSSPAVPTENYQYDIKLLRSSEVLLARAEAYAELNNVAMANADLTTIRTARFTNYVPVAYADRTALVNEVLLERFRELCFEGNRYYDLKRRNLPIERLLVDVAGNTAIQTLPTSSIKYILPVPFAETFANTSIQQNPGY